MNETDDSFPTLWRSPCNKARIIRCKDDLQYIVQGQQGGRWRNVSYHFGQGSLGWSSIHYRHAMTNEFQTLPDDPPTGPEPSLMDGETLFEMFLNGELDET